MRGQANRPTRVLLGSQPSAAERNSRSRGLAWGMRVAGSACPPPQVSRPDLAPGEGTWQHAGGPVLRMPLSSFWTISMNLASTSTTTIQLALAGVLVLAWAGGFARKGDDRRGWGTLLPVVLGLYSVLQIGLVIYLWGT